jgi:replicative DNA helicase
VLGAMMIDKKRGRWCNWYLQPDAFYKDAHKHILKLLFNCLLETAHWLINRFSTIKKKRKIRSGRWFYLIQLTQKISSSHILNFTQNYFTKIYST